MSHIVVIGDVMLDHYIYGEATRISPEAPIPVVNRRSESSFVGGAANVALNLAQLGARPTIIGAVGNDATARELIQLLENKEIRHVLIEKPIPTTRKTRVVANRYQVVRVDQEEVVVLVDEDINKVLDFLQNDKPSMVLMSDYDKGFCSKNLCSACMEFCIKNDIPVLVDPKRSDWEKFTGAFLIKPNQKEWEERQGVSYDTKFFEEKASSTIEELQIQHMVVTLGGKGMIHVNQKGVQQTYAPQEVEVFDVSGAGDTVLAVLAYSLDSGASLQASIQLANLAASYVITKPNTYPISLEELIKLKA